MTLFVLDTDHLSLCQAGHPLVLRNLALHVGHSVATTVVSVEEQFSGWQHAIRTARDNARREHAYRRLADLAQELAVWRVLPYPLAAILRHEQFVRARLNIGSFDLRIAAIVLEYQGTLVTRNPRDLSRINGLSLTDWSV